MVDRGAFISKDNLYRYWLSRYWDNNKNVVGWVMTNPSTGDHNVDDPTIRRCINFSKSWGYGGLIIVNLFAFRSKNPKDLRAPFVDPVGPDNNYYIKSATKHCGIMVAAWGLNGTYKNRDTEVVKFFPAMHYLKKSVNGVPLHPLYLPGVLKPQILT